MILIIKIIFPILLQNTQGTCLWLILDLGGFYVVHVTLLFLNKRKFRNGTEYELHIQLVTSIISA